MIFVVGSGPAGVACAVALLNVGLEVTMLDAGLSLEPDRAEVVEKMAQCAPEDWEPAWIGTIKEKMSVDVRGSERKYLFGSDFPYREAGKYIPTELHSVNMAPSLACGGLTNVWGAAVLPYTASDIDDWPLTMSELAPYYRSVLQFVDLAAMPDDLETQFPLYCENPHALQASRQAQSFMRDLEKNRVRLQSNRIFAGYSRLAVRSQPRGNETGCVYCGTCMYGCPYHLIYNSAFSLQTIKRNPNFRYINNVVVERISEAHGAVTIHGQLRGTEDRVTFQASRVYLACGVLPTTKILMESLGAYGQSVAMRDCLYFLLPLLRWHGAGRVHEEKLYTLAQIFLEIRDPRISGQTIHLQVYTYNELFRELVQGILGPFGVALRSPIEQFLSRLLLVQGFMPSQVSPSISIRLQRSQAEGNHLVLDPIAQPHSAKAIRRLMAKLVANSGNLKAIPMLPLLTLMKPGSSFHSGGTFPMRAHPGPFESDLLGRPAGFTKVHVVDPTIFPSIPGTTIVFTIMANAYRIASAYGQV